MMRSAVAVVDSSGKLPNGLMSGTAVSLGHFDQCLDIEAGDAFRGQFCNLELWLRDLPRPSPKAEDVIPDGDSVGPSVAPSSPCTLGIYCMCTEQQQAFCKARSAFRVAKRNGGN